MESVRLFLNKHSSCHTVSQLGLSYKGMDTSLDRM